uniref:Uncharacterized protein n=1 Tax=Cacopsylla melanoneura TaxID=428564 RepID=A0A8D8UHR9_9HEMI
MSLSVVVFIWVSFFPPELFSVIMRVTFMLVHLTADSAAVAAPAAVVVADVESEPADWLDLPAASFGLAEPRSGMKSISPVLAAVAAAARLEEGVANICLPLRLQASPSLQYSSVAGQ